MPKPLPSVPPPPSPAQTRPLCLIRHLCLEVLWWNATCPPYLSRCSLLAAIHFAAMLVLWLSDLSQAEKELEWRSKGQVAGNLGSCFLSLFTVYTSNWMINPTLQVLTLSSPPVCPPHRAHPPPPPPPRLAEEVHVLRLDAARALQLYSVWGWSILVIQRMWALRRAAES